MKRVRVWYGPLHEVWVEQGRVYGFNGEEVVLLRCTFGDSNCGVCMRETESELCSRGYRVLTSKDADAWLESIISDLDQQIKTLRRVQEGLDK